MSELWPLMKLPEGLELTNELEPSLEARGGLRSCGGEVQLWHLTKLLFGLETLALREASLWHLTKLLLVDFTVKRTRVEP